MNISRREKFVGKGRTKVSDKNKNKVNINFDIATLSLISSYVVSSNTNIRRSHLINLRNLFECMDMSVYHNDVDKLKLVNFIQKALEARLIKNIQDPTMVIKYTTGGIVDDGNGVMDVREFAILSNEELDWINETVSGALKYAFIENDIDRGIDIFTRFKASDYRSRTEIVAEIEEYINQMQTKFRRVKSQSLTDMTFSLKNGEYEDMIREVYSQVTSPNRKLQCGMQGINEMVAGGFEATRVYGLIGSTGIGKSLVLLNLAVQIKKYNKFFKPKDPTKIPTIVILTMENTVVETVTRLFNITTVSDEMKNYSVEDVIEMMKRDGELFLSDDSPINILIKYMPNRSVDTGYLYTLVEDLEDEGYETICLIQDHLKRIRSCYPQTDLRIELGEVVNEMKVFAQLKDIPVITNTHLNREAAKVVDEGRRNNKADLTRMMGRANVGESMLILDNIDCAFVINVEYDHNGQKYMVFSRVKMRDRASDRDYICQPFVKGNDIKLVEDYYSDVPAFKETLKQQPTENNLYTGNINTGRKKVNGEIKKISEIAGILDNFSDTNLFSGQSYKDNTLYPENDIQEIDETFYPAMLPENSPLQQLPIMNEYITFGA